MVFLERTPRADLEPVTVLDIMPPYFPCDGHQFVLKTLAAFSSFSVNVQNPWDSTAVVDVLVTCIKAPMLRPDGRHLMDLQSVIINRELLANAMKPMREDGRPIGYNDAMHRITTTTRFCAALMAHFSRMQPA